VGVVSPSSLSWINLTVSEGNLRTTLVVDSFAFGFDTGAAQAVPEPSSPALMTLSAGELGSAANRVKRAGGHPIDVQREI